jgi:SAM-dependent methyltransferase
MTDIETSRADAGFVRVHDGEASIDWRKKPSSLIANTLILDELRGFLDARWPNQDGAHLLDLGAGSAPYAPLYEPYFQRCTTVDVPHTLHGARKIDVFASADDLPFEDETFDCVLCTEVLEHCVEPARVLAEIHRVLRPGGAVFLSTPFQVGIHEAPYDYYRYTPFSLRYLAESNGLDVVSITERGDYGAVALGLLQYPFSLFWSFAAARTTPRLYGPANPFVLVTVIAPQLGYLALWRRARRARSPWVRRGLRRLSSLTLGYHTVLERPAKPPDPGGA